LGRPRRQIAFIESFNGKLRDECLNENVFVTLREAQEIVEAWRIDNNTLRPHSRLGNLSSAVYGATRSSAPEMHRGGTLRSARGFAPRPDAPRSEHSKQEQAQR
jgi:putative transposase